MTWWFDKRTKQWKYKIDQFLTFDNRVELGQTRSRSCHSWLDKKRRDFAENVTTMNSIKRFWKNDILYHLKQNWFQDLILPSNSFYSITDKCSSLLVKLE